ncbi:MAG: copper amine oxidase N-terminal domain-containing protein, partial [Clostridia bacterium]|nr:copper amine oxidase N-terminal domain-containing protein [Clostridia bacterium]
IKGGNALRKLLNIIIVAILIALLTPGTALAAVKNLTISVHPLTPGAASQFNIGFYTSNSGALRTDDRIKIEFPEGTVIPAGISSGQIFINGKSVNSSNIYVSNNLLTLKLSSDMSIADNEYVGVVIPQTAGIKAPFKGGSYYLLVSTTRDGEAKSNLFTISGSRITRLEVMVSPSTAEANADYDINFTVSSKGALAAKDFIYIEFAPEVKLPKSISRSHIEVNGDTASAVDVDITNNIVAIEVPSGSNIRNNDKVTVTITAGAGISNPRDADKYELGVYTSKDSLLVEEEYQIGLSIGSPVVLVSPIDAGASSQYSIGFTTSSRGSLSSGSGYIYLYFPSGTYVPDSISESNVTVNGYPARLVSSSRAEREMAIRIPSSIDIPKNSYVQVVIKSAAGLENPNSAGNYRLDVATSADTGRAKSNVYTIEGGSGNSNDIEANQPQVELSSYAPGNISDYWITVFAAKNWSVRDGDQLILTFPTGTTIPSGISTGHITVNDEFAEDIVVSGRNLFIELPWDMRVREDDKIVVHISSSAGIKNPETAGSYIIEMKTPENSYEVESKAYTIGTTGSTPITPPPSTGGQIIFKIGSTLASNGGVLVSLDVAPTIISDFTVVPLRALGDALGADTSYNATDQSVTVKYNNKTLVFHIGSRIVDIDSSWVVSDIAPTLIKDRVMIPVRFVSQHYGATVNWNATTQEVTIIK